VSATEAAPSRRTHPGAGLAVLMIVGGGFLTQLLMAVTGVVSARMLGVDGRGQVVLVASLAMLASQLTLGGSLPNAITRQLADRSVTARDGLSHLVGRWALWGLLAALAAGGIFLVIEHSDSGSAKYALAVGVVLTAIQMMASRILVGAMLGEGTDLLHVGMTSVLPQALTTVVIAVAFGVGVRWNAVELTAVTIACVGAVLLARLRLLAKPTHDPAAALDRRELAALARRTQIGSIGPLDGLGIDRTLVGALMGSVSLGLYSAAFALTGLSTILGGGLAMVILPRITVAQRDPATVPAVVRRWLLSAGALIIVVVTVLDVAARPVIRLTFGPDFVAAAACAHWLLAASGLLDFRRVMIAVMQGRNRGGRASVIELSLTPFVIAGIAVASIHHSLVAVGVAMFVVACVACLLHGTALVRSRPGVRYVPQHARTADRTVAGAAEVVAAPVMASVDTPTAS
jgi:O-antigen/teichoic acid export membrane protein